ncbi:hypothetical protein AB0E62_36565 [Streptomyces sp. NPDC038707]|uniref:hypothetical protein n=1 Tax=Streptomyces sp. NPDC038707 TaxID=3154329 RepID=UPI0033E66C5C
MASATPVPASPGAQPLISNSRGLQRAADQYGTGLVHKRAGTGNVMAGAVDPAAQQLFVFTVHRSAGSRR